MKHKLFVLLIICCSYYTLAAQSENDTIPHFLLRSSLPNFKVLITKEKIGKAASDSSWYTQDSLPKNTFTVLVYFSPECSHCQLEAQQLRKYADSFSNAQFVWMSYSYSNTDLWNFYQKYELNLCRNVVLGKILTYQIPAYFKVAFTPYIAVFNAQKQFVTEFRKGTTIGALQKWLK